MTPHVIHHPPAPPNTGDAGAKRHQLRGPHLAPLPHVDINGGLCCVQEVLPLHPPPLSLICHPFSPPCNPQSGKPEQMEQKMFPAETQKCGGNNWAGSVAASFDITTVSILAAM